MLFYDIFYDLTLKIRPKFAPFCCGNEHRRKSISKRAYHRAENRIQKIRYSRARANADVNADQICFFDSGY